jgi:hypothetical protein
MQLKFLFLKIFQTSTRSLITSKSPHAVVRILSIKRHKEAKQSGVDNHIPRQRQVASSPFYLKQTQISL